MENQPLHPNPLGSTKVSGAVDDSTARQADEADNPLASLPPVPVGGYGPHSRHTPLRAADAKTTALAHRHAPNMQPCPQCGAMQPTSTSVCMACGTFFPAHKSSNIRCRHCGTHASANLTLCPKCGRRLQAAPFFATRWIVPVVLVILFLFLIRQWSGLQTLHWTQAQATAGWNWLNALGERLDPQITIATLPDTLAPDTLAPDTLAPDTLADGSVVGPGSTTNPSEPAQLTLGELLETGVNAIAVAPTAIDSSLNTENSGEANVTASVTATVVEVLAVFTTTTAPPASPAAAASTGEETLSPTATPSPTLPPTATTVPPATVPPTPSATQVPTRANTVTASPTATGIEQATPARQLTQVAAQQQIAASALDDNRQATAVGSRGAVSILQPTSTFASDVDPDVELDVDPDRKTPDAGEQAATTSPTATVTPVPSSTPTDVPTATTIPTAIPTATPAPATTYVIKSGDTPITIAARYGVGVNALLAANGLGLEDARRLRVGQELIIPNGIQPSPTATVPPTATPPTSAATALPPAPSATDAPPPADSSGIRLDRPQLRSPESGSALSCGAENSLTWLPVPFIREDNMYLLHLGFLTGYNTDGTETIVWVLEQQQPANVTIWHMDEGLCSLAPQTFGRQWRWYVEVIETAENSLQPVSLPSSIWAFSWN